jgi:transcriptional regulator with XRE-family HTH domain
MNNLFGTKIRSLREAQGLMQRHVAYHLDIDSPMLSNVERGDRKARREWIPKLAQLLKANEDELLTAWLADRIQELVQDEKVAKDTIKTVATKMGMKVK